MNNIIFFCGYVSFVLLIGYFVSAILTRFGLISCTHKFVTTKPLTIDFLKQGDIYFTERCVRCGLSKEEIKADKARVYK